MGNAAFIIIKVKVYLGVSDKRLGGVLCLLFFLKKKEKTAAIVSVAIASIVFGK